MTQAVLDQLKASLSQDLTAVLPELFLCGGIVLMLLVRLFRFFDRHHLGWVALAVTLGALWITWAQWTGNDYVPPGARPADSFDLFSGLLVYDGFALFVKLFLFGFTALVILLALMTGIPDREDSADFFTLLLGATVGMSVMATANHLLMVFLGVEMASLPSYALAGFLKGRRQSSEAALKYVVYGGGAAGVMLYGISLLAGKFGTAYLPDVVRYVAAGGLEHTVLLGVLFVLVGIGFKLAAFPFHFWCPDVFEGAAAEVGAYLSVASKGAALALLARVVLGIGGLTGPATDAVAWHSAVPYLVPIIAIFAVITNTFGNLAAYPQTNLKRLLAYSTIAHAGFMMMGLATLTRDGAGAVLFYLVVYLFMNLGAFAVIAFLRNQTGSEDLRDFRGLVYRSPVAVVTLAVFLVSLLGLPPLGGFAAKLQILLALWQTAEQYEAAGHAGLGYILYAIIVAGALNSVLAAFYYFRVFKVMALEKPLEEVEGRPVRTLPLPAVHATFLTVIAVLLVGLGGFWGPLAGATTDRGVENFRVAPAAARGPADIQVAKGDRP
jgi:NADH-quinone oxidoreductase subunit N